VGIVFEPIAERGVMVKADAEGGVNTLYGVRERGDSSTLAERAPVSTGVLPALTWLENACQADDNVEPVVF
jgi:hypothetical protein